MSEKSLYIRPYLMATAANAVAPAPLVASWLDCLEELRASADAEELSEPEDCFTLLALEGRLRRVRDDLRDTPEARSLLLWVEERVPEISVDDVDAALKLFFSEQWIAGAADLEQAWLEAAISEEEAIERAENALTDWDDLTLILAGAEKRRLIEVEDARWEPARQCEAWAADHAEAFFAASTWIQTMGAAFRPDLEETDYDLADTAGKIVFLLSRIEQFEKEWRGHPDHVAAQRRRFHEILDRIARREYGGGKPYLSPHEQSRRLRGKRVADVIRRSMTPTNALAAGTPLSGAVSDATLPWETLRFVSPGGEYVAKVMIPRVRHPESEISFGFRTDQGVAAETLVGMPFWFCGITAAIGKNGLAAISTRDVAKSVEDLVQGGGIPRLEVGLKGVAWSLDVPET